MRKLHKFNLKKTCFSLAATLFCIVLTLQLEARCNYKGEIYSTLTRNAISDFKFSNSDFHFPHLNDTLPPVKTSRQKPQITNNRLRPLPDTLPQDSSGISNSDTLPKQRVDTFTLKTGKDTLDAPVHYEAEDSAVLMVKEQKFFLYGHAKTTYKDIELNAPTVELNQQTNILNAWGTADSTGHMVTRVQFTQGTEKFESDSIQYNFKTQKGLTKNTYTQEGELFIKAGTAKKINANTMFIKEGYYTTCDLDDPHFAFKTDRLKVINNKLAVSGPTHPEIEGVPIPIWLPFGIYPLSQGRHSGLLPPQFTANEQFGLGLEGLGYYQVLNDYYDVTVRGNIYSYGGWSLNLTPTYRKRYRYTGSFNIAFQHTKIAFKGDPDYSLQKTFNITWSHSVDSRAKPGTSFSANVNAGSTKFNQLIPNNPIQNITNQLYSSISYAKQWSGEIPMSLQLSANHNQNNTTGLINVTLPDAGFTVPTIYPFQKKEIIGTPKWYEKIGIGYTGVFRNQLSFYDSGHVQISKLLDTLQWGARHTIPISIQLPPIAGVFFLSPSLSYEETWLTHRYGRVWDNTLKKIDTVTVRKGLFIDRHASFGASFNTTIYGNANFKSGPIRAIRHVIRPTFGISYTPNMSKQFYDVVQVDSLGHRQAISQFGGDIFSGYGYGSFGGVSFGVDNTLQIRVKDKKDTTAAKKGKKINLIDGFGFTSGYNFLGDSLRLQPFNLYLRSTLFEKISLTASALLDPYQTSGTGIDINRFVWQDGTFSLGRLQYVTVAMSTSFQSKPRDASKTTTTEKQNKITEPSLLADRQNLVDYMHRNPAEFVDFNIPWSINLSFSLSLNKSPKADYSGFNNVVSSALSFSNSFSLTPKWNFSTNGFFDLNTKQMTMFTMSISRDMHCWQMSINTTPIGNYRFFNITINPKSSLLQDLKVNRTRYFLNNY